LVAYDNPHFTAFGGIDVGDRVLVDEVVFVRI
jgi:hypothetical protein